MNGPSFRGLIADFGRRQLSTIRSSESRSPSMSSVTSSTSTMISPYATVNEQIKPGKFEANEKEYGVAGAAVLGLGDAIAEGASATVSLSEKALGAVEDAGKYVGQAGETGITDHGSA